MQVSVSSIRLRIENIDQLLELAKEKLRAAQTWGVWDLMGGGFLSSLIKHGRMDDAQELLQEVKDELGLLNRELDDLDLDVETSLEPGINRFFDIFMDNIFSDLLSQSKINKALADIWKLQEALDKVYKSLEDYNEL